MDASERALDSVLAADETLVTTWTVGAIRRGFARRPPQFGADLRLGLTDRRLAWIDEELQSVDRERIDGAETGTVTVAPAPTVVRIGGLAAVLGLVGTAVAWLLGWLSLPAALAPLTAGLAVLVGTALYARFRGLTSARTDYHYCRIDTDEAAVTVFADAETVASIADTLEGAGRE